MFELFDDRKQKFPIRVWLESAQQIDDVCLQQSINLSNLPFLHKWVALMPDTHQGFGMPIGGVIALKGHVIPNAVGVDIGCGIAYVETNLHMDDLNGSKRQQIIQKIMETIPVGFSRQENPMACAQIDEYLERNEEALSHQKLLLSEAQRAKFQLGTLGGGNHFIELQKDQEGKIAIMIHSGSRHFGYQVANHFDEKASLFCRKSGDKRTQKQKLAYLPSEHPTGKEYLLWMKLAMNFAYENRKIMMERVCEILERLFPSFEATDILNVHHNYAALETHYGEAVWVHRKGAIRAGGGEWGIIPGAMGSSSYIVTGKGNVESFESCSHGAGRHFSRKQAIKALSRQEVLDDLNALQVSIGIPPESLIADESRFAYKDINFVMTQQSDLVNVEKELRTVLVVKG